MPSLCQQIVVDRHNLGHPSARASTFWTERFFLEILRRQKFILKLPDIHHLQVKVAAGGNLQGINEETNACHGEQAAAGWFGNSSSALDTLFQPSKPNTSNAILPTDDLPTLFSKQGLAKYTDLFVRHEVDLQTFATLTEQDLREIGVPTFGARKKLLLLANSKFF